MEEEDQVIWPLIVGIVGGLLLLVIIIYLFG